MNTILILDYVTEWQSLGNVFNLFLKEEWSCYHQKVVDSEDALIFDRDVTQPGNLVLYDFKGMLCYASFDLNSHEINGFFFMLTMRRFYFACFITVPFSIGRGFCFTVHPNIFKRGKKSGQQFDLLIYLFHFL